MALYVCLDCKQWYPLLLSNSIRLSVLLLCKILYFPHYVYQNNTTNKPIKPRDLEENMPAAHYNKKVNPVHLNQDRKEAEIHATFPYVFGRLDSTDHFGRKSRTNGFAWRKRLAFILSIQAVYQSTFHPI